MRERSWRQMQGLTWPPPGPSSWLYILGLTPPQLRKRGWAGERILMLPHLPVFLEASQVALVGKNLPANIGDIIDVSSIPGSGRSPGGGHAGRAGVGGDGTLWITDYLSASPTLTLPQPSLPPNKADGSPVWFVEQGAGLWGSGGGSGDTPGTRAAAAASKPL